MPAPAKQQQQKPGEGKDSQSSPEKSQNAAAGNGGASKAGLELGPSLLDVTQKQMAIQGKVRLFYSNRLPRDWAHCDNIRPRKSTGWWCARS